jgi:hypothetical protein
MTPIGQPCTCEPTTWLDSTAVTKERSDEAVALQPLFRLGPIGVGVCGSTLAAAHSVGITLTLEDFQAVSDKTPFLADLKPSGKYVMEDLHKVGGTPGVLKVGRS